MLASGFWTAASKPRTVTVLNPPPMTREFPLWMA
jgi:hypothetical protein